MIALLSPAKTLDPGPAHTHLPRTEPRFVAEACALVTVLRQLSGADLEKLLHISPALAQLNHERFLDFSGDAIPSRSKQAALMYRGDTYKGLDADSLDETDWPFAQRHVRILSGLYGLLRPLDAIQPYRLEMATPLVTAAAANLYAFWSDRIAKEIDACIAQQSEPQSAYVINLASDEYTRAVAAHALTTPMITPVFKESRGAKLQVIGLLAKKARGKMARYLIKNRLCRVEQLRSFNEDGYCFRSDLSDDNHLVFVR
ncbi:MAG: peroxide stress protein YaaA [Magnetococcales bacterium]|nr:peroxide stress protein YaaA [Magnetococcales bacterium]